MKIKLLLFLLAAFAVNTVFAQHGFTFKVEPGNDSTIFESYVADFSSPKHNESDLPKAVANDVKSRTGWHEFDELVIYNMHIKRAGKIVEYCVFYADGYDTLEFLADTARYFIYNKATNKLVQTVYHNAAVDEGTKSVIRRFLNTRNIFTDPFFFELNRIVANGKTYIIYDAWGDALGDSDENLSRIRYIFNANGQYLGTLKITDNSPDLEEIMYTVLVQGISFRQ